MEKQILSILEHYKLNNAQLAEKLGIQRSNVSHILSGRSKPSLDLIQKILTKFPKINSDWLLLDKGEMHTSVTKPIAKPYTLEQKNTEPKNTYTPPTPQVEKPDRKKNKNTKTEKIIIFHSDNTFTEYHPKKD